MIDDLNLDGLVEPPPLNVSGLIQSAPAVSHLPELLGFIQEKGLVPGSTTNGRHNAGSKHYSGNAVDLKGSGAYSDAQVAALKQDAATRGFLVRDERTRPANQKVWGGPHVHIEYVGNLSSPSDNLNLDGLVEPLNVNGLTESVIPPVPVQLSTNDTEWHFGENIPNPSPRAMRVLQEAVTEDERKKKLYGHVDPPDIVYQNKMRAKAGLPPLQVGPTLRAAGQQQDRPLGGNPLMPTDRTAPAMDLRSQIARQVEDEYGGFASQLAVPLSDPLGAITKSREQMMNEEIDRRVAAQQRSQTPEMIAERKQVGGEGAIVRALDVPVSKLVAGLGKTGAGLTSGFGLAPNRLSDYLTKRSQVIGESTDNPIDESGNPVIRSLPEKATSAVVSLGLSVAQLVLLKRATGLGLGTIMATETALQTSDQPLRDRASAVFAAYGMGKVLDQHLSKPVSAALFGGPTAIQSGLAYSQGKISLEDALLETGVQVGAGALLGGRPKAEITIPDVPGREFQTKPEVGTMPEIPDVPVSSISEPRVVKGGGYAKEVRSNQEQVGVEGRPSEAGQNVRSENLQQPAQTGPEASNAQGLNLKGLTEPEQPNTVVPTTLAAQTIPLEQLSRSELMRRVRQGGARKAEYENELMRRHETRGLVQFVRDSGGIAPSDLFQGELSQLGPKETGTTGLINRNAEAGGGRKMTPEYMMDAANAEGYRDLDGKPFENIGNFLDAVASDLKGRKQFTRLGADNHVDFEKEYRDSFPQQQEVHDADAIVSLLENEESGQIYDRIVEGTANEADLAKFRDLATREYLSPQATEDLIASAREGSFQENPGLQTEANPQTPVEAAQPEQPAFAVGQTWRHPNGRLYKVIEATPETVVFSDPGSNEETYRGTPTAIRDWMGFQYVPPKQTQASPESQPSTFSVGQTWEHPNGRKYVVREVTPESIIFSDPGSTEETYRGAPAALLDWMGFTLKSERQPTSISAKETKPLETTGIAQRVEEARRQGEVPRGEGITAEASVERGRELLRKGRDPQSVVDEFKKTGAVSSDAMALVRARHEELARAANRAFDEGQHSLNDPKFQAAEKARQDFWENSVKPMQTEWHKTGMAQQGETDIDTGTFYGLYRAFKQQTGREMTPKEEQAAKQITSRVASTDQGVRDAEKELVDRLNQATGIKDLPPDVQGAIKKFIDQSRREARTEKRQQTRKSLDDEAATIKTNLAAAFQKVKNQTGVQPSGLARIDPEGEITKLVLDYAKNRAKAGLTDAAQLIDDVHGMVKEFADVTKREVAEALSGMGVPKREIKSSEWLKVKKNIREGMKAEDKASAINQLRGQRGISPEDAKTIWQYAREKYIDKGVEVGDAIQKTARDLETTPDQIRRALANQPKVKPLTDELYRRMSARRQAKTAAESWVKNADRSPAVKALEGLRDAFFNLKTFGHGTVGPITHAGKNLFIPGRWADYFRNVGRTWKAAYSASTHERMMQDLVNDPNYITARRAGLANEPGKFYDDYQNTQMQKLFGVIGKIGNRGFDVLKTMRQDFFNSQWNKLEDSQKTPEMAKAIADICNHATGAIRTRIPFSGLTRGVFFAPSLEGSRWATLFGDPARAINAFSNWSKASPSEQYFAKQIVKQHAQFLGTYVAALALNQGLLSAAGSKDKVNFLDPSKGDWLRFKIAGRSVELTGGIIGTVDFLGKLAVASIGAKKPNETRYETMGKAVAQYARGKLSPIASTGADVISQADFTGRPLPFSRDKTRKGNPRYSWPEYLLTQQSPIPMSEAVRDIYSTLRKQGMGQSKSKVIVKGLIVGTISGGTGIRIGEEYKSLKPSHGGLDQLFKSKSAIPPVPQPLNLQGIVEPSPTP